MACAICRTRRPRRFCPGVRGDICAVCCGTEREVTVDCPLDCEYLLESRKHDRTVPFDAEQLPNRDISLPEEFLDENEILMRAVAFGLRRAVFEIPGVVDSDMREAIEALVRTYRTLQSGVYYESRPDNQLAADIFTSVQDAIARFRSEEQQRSGMTRTRDADVLRALVFFQRLELDRNNGRRHGRAFIDVLRQFQPDEADSAPPPSSLILP